jgi:hypothetical protein
MACVLKRQDDGSFRGKAGRTIQVDVRSTLPATTVRIVYAAEQDGVPPFEFTIKAGRQKLLVLALGVTNDQRIRIVEVSDPEDCHLKNFFWSSTHFHTTLDIEGV